MVAEDGLAGPLSSANKRQTHIFVGCTMTASWSKAVEPTPVIEDFLKHTVNLVNGNPSYEPASYFRFITFLMSSIEFKEEISEHDRRIVFRKAISAFSSSDKRDSKMLIWHINSHAHSYLRAPKLAFNVFMPVSLGFTSKFSRKIFKVEGVNIRFKHMKQCNLTFGNVLDRAKASMGIEIPAGYNCMIISVQARTAAEAMGIAQDATDKIIGIINFVIGKTGIVVIGSPPVLPLNPVLVGPIQTVHDQSGAVAEDLFWYEPNPPTRKRIEDISSVEEDVATEVRTMLKALTKTEYCSQVLGFIARYNKALSSTSEDGCFIQLWSVLESVLGAQDGGSEIMIKRMSEFFTTKAAQTQHLKALRHLRNGNVHHGMTRSEWYPYIAQLREYVIIAIKFLIFAKPKFKSFQHFLDVLDVPPQPRDINKRLARLKYEMSIYKRALKDLPT
ncbi:hypothetical protein FW320_26655 [Azospirillum sp. Vi22]|uniref:hypothetical protein n=1 Tax=Azospirillum baldaniorum TaxID=1064539 RepID=UPI00157A85EC|nr:hypothetical protein [Azospirillum baldaniorum]NUB09728.1 hypothetical protein [Azospirillum baldaniorum]